MDTSKEGFLLIGTATIILIAIAIAFFAVMLIYRRRKMEHLREVEAMKEKYHKEMLETQVDIQKDTMQQIGREIHDNVGQKLTLAALYAEHLNLEENKVPTPEKISSITGLINESLNDLRELSQNLTNPPGGAAGLDILLQKEVTKLMRAEVCSIHFESNGNPIDLSLKVNTMVLRITQEFLHNSIRHAACKNIFVRIVHGPAGLQLSLSDDGKGFIADEMNAGSGIGIDNMKKRARLISAELSLKSSPGKGTNLDLFIPAENII
jgi:signal transduction histidine kinase